MKPVCLTCKERIEAPSRGKKYCSRPCWYKSRKGIIPKNIITLYTPKLNRARSAKLREDKSPLWKGSRIGYSAIHTWLRLYANKKSECANCKKIGRTEWALKKGKIYERKKVNFLELCASCHRKYDEIGKKGWITRRKNKKHA